MRRVDDVEVLTIDNPPVNAINSAARSAIADRLNEIRNDDSVAGVVVEGAGRMFSGGGDLREIGKPEPPDAPTLNELTYTIEQFPKPVVCALHGAAIGGGLLLAMACHARLAAPDLRAALPEVLLGFVPGTGGTQRLPRLVGLCTALDMIVLARRLDAAAAEVSGLVDAIAEEPGKAAIEWVRSGPHRRTRDLPVAAADAGLAALYAEKAAAAFPGRMAPQRAIEVVLGAAHWPFDEGVQRSQALSRAMMETEEARALVHDLLTRNRRRG